MMFGVGVMKVDSLVQYTSDAVPTAEESVGCGEGQSNDATSNTFLPPSCDTTKDDIRCGHTLT